jgi:hypothetical protein
VCTVLIVILVEHMCYNNNNTYFWSFDTLDWFKLNIASCFRLLCSLKLYGYIPIVFVLLLSCSVVTPANLLLLFWGVTVDNQSIGFYVLGNACYAKI